MHTRIIFFCSICVAVLVPPMLLIAPAEAGPNLGTHLPLHAVINPPAPPPCEIGDPCAAGSITVDVPVGSTIHAYLLVRNYDDIGGVQTAFDWGNWTFVAGAWACQPGQICGTEPHGSGGSYEGTIATAFDCITGGHTAVIGFMRFMALEPGCLSQVESSFPFGTFVVSCSNEMFAVDPVSRGAICAGQPGVNACEPPIGGAGENQETTLPLHAIVIPGSPPDPCEIADPCDPGPALVNVPINTTIDAYLMARHYDNLFIVQTAFEWDGWTYLGSAWNCQSGQITGNEPYGNGGPDAGTLATAFDCVAGGQTAILGYMRFFTDGPGCLTQVESSRPYGSHVFSCADEWDPISLLDCGSICVDAGGIDACEGITPVELARFEITLADGQVQLEWQTTAEFVGHRFDLFRRELDRTESVRINDVEIEATGGDRSRYVFVDQTAAIGHTYEYRLESIDPSGGRRETAGTVQVTVAGNLSRQLILHQNRPNPFNPSSVIAFELPAPGRVSLRIYDATGRLVRSLVDGMLERGRHDVEWSGEDELGHAAGSGVYIYRLETGGMSLTRRMVLLR